MSTAFFISRIPILFQFYRLCETQNNLIQPAPFCRNRYISRPLGLMIWLKYRLATVVRIYRTHRNGTPSMQLQTIYNQWKTNVMIYSIVIFLFVNNPFQPNHFHLNSIINSVKLLLEGIPIFLRMRDRATSTPLSEIFMRCAMSLLDKLRRR